MTSAGFIKHKTYRFALKLTSSNQSDTLRAQFTQTAGCCRKVYNMGLAVCKTAYEADKTSFSEIDLCGLLPGWKGLKEFDYLNQAPAVCLQQAMRNLNMAYDRFFKQLSAFPKPKKRGDRDAFRFPAGPEIQLDQKNKKIKLGKFGWVRYAQDRTISLTQKISQVTVCRRGTKWFVNILTTEELPAPQHPSSTSVGIDLGVVHFAALHFPEQNGVKPPPELKDGLKFDKLQRKIGKLQKSIARKDRLRKKKQKREQEKRDAASKIHGPVWNDPALNGPFNNPPRPPKPHSKAHQKVHPQSKSPAPAKMKTKIVQPQLQTQVVQNMANQATPSAPAPASVKAATFLTVEAAMRRTIKPRVRKAKADKADKADKEPIKAAEIKTLTAEQQAQLKEKLVAQQEADKEKARLKAEKLLKQQDHAILVTQRFIDQMMAWQQRPVFRQPKSKRQLKLEEKKIQLEQRIVNQRNDYQHKLSAELTLKHALIIVEDLNIQAMTASAAGTPDDPGVNVKWKARQNRSARDQGWGRFLELLEYKQAWQGGRFLRVPAYYTSQKCPRCQHIDENNRPTRAIFKCVSCHHEEHADVIASENIYERGLKILNTPTSELPMLVKMKPSVKNKQVASKTPPVRERDLERNILI